MSRFTYENETTKTPLETYEWDNVWWEQTNKTDIPRVLYIGDSISCGTRTRATAAAQGKLLFDGFGTSKALDNPYFKDTLRLFTRQQESRCAILFNNGLHGWHLQDDSEYKQYYEEMIQFLLQEFPGTPLLLVLTTHVANAERDARVVIRNGVVTELAKQYGLPTVDLFAITKEHDDLFTDGVHLKPDGYVLLAEELVKSVQAVTENEK